MKKLTTIFLFLLPAIGSFANAIDSLKTVDDIVKFIHSKIDSSWKEEDIFDSLTLNNIKYGRNSFHKVDLNNDGRTDIIINGRDLFAIVDDGKGKYSIHNINRGTFLLEKFAFEKIIYINKTPLVLVHSVNGFAPKDTATTATEDTATNKDTTGTIAPVHVNLIDVGNGSTDTLIFRFNDFVEYNTSPDKLNIQKIKFATSGCYGTCPVFELSIDSHANALLNAIEYNSNNSDVFDTTNSLNGHYTADINMDDFNNILDIINYIHLPKLKDDYSVNWTDDQTATLEIKYNNGHVKKISDYGEIGTMGLQLLYGKLFSLRFTQKWTKKE